MHGLILAKIGRGTIATRLAVIAAENGPIAADRARASLSALFGWALREGLCDTKPVIGTDKASEARARDRVLSDKELAEIWQALGDDYFGSIAKLLMLTGCRREEIGGLRYSELKLESGVISLPGERTKNHRPHDVPLSAPACAILGAFVPSRSRAKAALDDRLKQTKPWRLHDLRRTAVTVRGLLSSI